jgi:uncharacterized HAD superfamily protein
MQRFFMSAFPIHPSRIGFDIDGVVADTSGAFLRIAREEYGLHRLRHDHITDFDVAQCLDVPPEVIDAIFDRLLLDPLGEGLLPMAHAIPVLQEFALAGQLSFITARPYREPIAGWLEHTLGATLFRKTRLAAMGDHDGKTDYIKEWDLDYFVDDRARTCHQLARAGITPIVFNQPWNLGQHHFLTVDDWPAILQLCTGTH